MVVGNGKESLDQFALTKAAAWAWYERGSWFENNSIPESDLRRSSHDFTPKPSRYKLEAMKKSRTGNRGSSRSSSDELLLCNKNIRSSLLDMYEIQRISKELDSSFRNQLKSVEAFDEGGRKIVKSSQHIKGTRKKHNWFGIRHRVMCGSNSDDVVVPANSIVRGIHRGKG